MRNEGIVGRPRRVVPPGFWREEIANGMPRLTVPGISTGVERRDDLVVDWRAWTVTLPDGRVLQGNPLNDRALAMLEAGGRYNLLLAEREQPSAQPSSQLSSVPDAPPSEHETGASGGI